MLTLALMLSCLFVVSISAEVVTYDDAPARTNIEVKSTDLIKFDDGFTTLSAYVVKDDKTFGWKQNAYDFTFINGKTGAGYGYDNIVELDIPQGVTSITTSAFASNKVIKRVSLPDSVTSIGGTIFEYSSSLEEFTFEHNADSNLKVIPNWMFANCTSLKAISFPDCVTKFTGNAQLGGCTNLTAIYLPKNLVSTEGADNGNGTFGKLTNAYFVNEPFTYDNIPEKPDVYYFPAGYYTATGEAFDTCLNMNKVLVFSANNVEFNNAWMFENVACDSNKTKPTVIFKGNVKSINVGSWNVNAIYFANENDIDATSAGVTGSKTIYYCHAKGNTQHLTETVETIDATCTTDKAQVSYCFCGTEVSRVTVEGTAGHSLVTYVGIIYDNYLSDGYYGYACENCEYVGSKGQTAPALFVWKGYSRTESAFGGTYSVAQCFYVNKTAVEAYASQEGKVFSFGVLAAGNKDGNEISPELGGNVQYNEFTSLIHDYFEIKVSGITSEYLNTKLVFCAYVIDDGDMYYLDDNATKTALSGKSYSDING